jgi:hypothetical protein
MSKHLESEIMRTVVHYCLDQPRFISSVVLIFNAKQHSPIFFPHNNNFFVIFL